MLGLVESGPGGAATTQLCIRPSLGDAKFMFDQTEARRRFGYSRRTLGQPLSRWHSFPVRCRTRPGGACSLDLPRTFTHRTPPEVLCISWTSQLGPAPIFSPSCSACQYGPLCISWFTRRRSIHPLQSPLPYLMILAACVPIEAACTLGLAGCSCYMAAHAFFSPYLLSNSTPTEVACSRGLVASAPYDRIC